MLVAMLDKVALPSSDRCQHDQSMLNVLKFHVLLPQTNSHVSPLDILNLQAILSLHNLIFAHLSASSSSCLFGQQFVSSDMFQRGCRDSQTLKN